MIDRFQAQMQALQMLSRAQEMTADNLANMNTPGFKGNKLFHRMVTEQINGTEVTRTEAMQQVNMEQGILEPTGNLLDFGITGEGFFVIEDEGETLLSRDGRFQFDPDGYLRNSQGGYVQGESGAIHVPEYFMAADSHGGNVNLEVAKDGTIRLNDEVYDRIRLVEVDAPEQLQRRGNSYFSTDPGSMVAEVENSMLMQGYYEKGNVSALHEMVDMMRNMQMFEAQQRAMRTTDEMLAQATNSLGRF